MKINAEGSVDHIGPFFWGTHSVGKIKFFTFGFALWRAQILFQWFINR